MVGMVATMLPPGARVLCPEGEFTSLTFPFLARKDLRLDVVAVPLEDLAGSISPGTDLVAFSLVQSADGRVADVRSIRSAASEHGALTLVDATQAAGWLPFDATDYDITVTAAYKWLLSPRGTAFMTLRPELLERVQPLYAGWYAGPQPWDSIYGLPLRLAEDARRLDLSPAWHAWVGTAASLLLLNDVRIGHIHAHDVSLANALRVGLDMEPSDSAMVSLDLDPDFDVGRLSGLKTAFRDGRLRVGFHLYNSADDVARLLEAISA
jgi:selenocysteine lyase/cysteine desulfurase